MSYTFGSLAALGIARCNINQSRSPSWLSVSYVTLVAAVTFLVGLAADTISVDVLVEKFLALSAVNYFISHNIRCFCFFHAHTSRNTHQTSRRGRNLGQNARTLRSISPYLALHSSVLSMGRSVISQNPSESLYGSRHKSKCSHSPQCSFLFIVHRL